MKAPKIGPELSSVICERSFKQHSRFHKFFHSLFSLSPWDLCLFKSVFNSTISTHFGRWKLNKIYSLAIISVRWEREKQPTQHGEKRDAMTIFAWTQDRWTQIQRERKMMMICSKWIGFDRIENSLQSLKVQGKSERDGMCFYYVHNFIGRSLSSFIGY